jgi:S-formylglutathione hydrolase FrmB
MNGDANRSHRLLTCQWASPALGCDKRVSVLVPSVPSLTGRHPVLVLLHGYGANRGMWISRTRVLEYLRGTGLLVILPESGRRWFINDHAGRRYEDYLIHELVPHVKREFTVAPDRRGWAIGGFSMGGAAALMQALRHPDVFSVVASHAGAFEAPLRTGDPYASKRSSSGFAMPPTEIHERVWGPPGSATRRRYDPYTLIESLDSGMDLRVYADVGSEDHERIVSMNRNMVAALRQARIPIEYHERPGEHNVGFLNDALPFSLDFVCVSLESSPSSASAVRRA